MVFQFRTAQQILFGRGEHQKAPKLCLQFGKRVFLVTGAESLKRHGVLEPVLADFSKLGVQVQHATVSGEPDLAQADELSQKLREAGSEVVLAMGGGSVLDVGKAAAALSQNDGLAIEYLEDVGLGLPRPLCNAPLPVIAVPTTAGSGSEATRNAVLRVPELQVKRSLRSDLLLPRVAIVDPDLSATSPLRVAAAAGMDALTHLIEGYLSKGAQPMTDALAVRGIGLLWNGLHALAETFSKRAEFSPPPVQMQQQLALGSLWGGIVLANAGLGAVHGLVAPLGGLCRVAHGDGCACLLPATFATNARALFQRQKDSPAAQRMMELCGLLADGQQDPERATERLETLRTRLSILNLQAQGVTESQFPQILQQCRGGSMRSNPIELTDDELCAILRASFRGGNGAKDTVLPGSSPGFPSEGK